LERIVECVPNFSEGRRPEVIAELVAAVESIDGTAVLDTHVDPDHHRSVITFVGGVEVIVEAAVRVARRAAELIDLRRHVGVHPRVGALDVLPFVPVRGVTLEDCIHLAHAAGERIARDVGVPVYFYESAARKPDRVNLEDVRRGGFEQLREEIGTNPERAPDEGAPRVHETAGACIVGARSLLIAYNINLHTTDITVARRIARAVRGRDGGLRFLKALGFELRERGLTQVSMNLVRFEKTELHHAFEAVRREAERYGVRVAGSEIVGLIPQAALDRSAEYFLQIENFSPELILENRIASALARRRDEAAGQRQRDDNAPASWSAEVEAEAVARRGVMPQTEVKRTANECASNDFNSANAYDASTHAAIAATDEITGGGAAAAHAASLAAALGEMVAHLIKRKGQQEDMEREARDALQALNDLRARLAEAADEDGASFAGVLGARRMPGRTDEERRARANAVEEALKGAAAVPLETASLAVQVGELLETLAELGEPAWLSDAATGAQLAFAATVAARYNVLVNTAEIEDEEFVSEHVARADDLLERAREIAARVEVLLLESIGR
jgi:glutamate formiminotransferase/formiminotetrahydrofolate cyclodeaminase